MNERTDSQLLRAYVDHQSEAAFRELVSRHLDLVHSAALRMVRDPHLAQDVSQRVFLALANNAARLTARPTLASWLHRTAQNIAAQLVRTDVRRRAREQEAAAMNQILATDSEAGWEQIEPHLDAALGELNDPDRDAILLRYFDRKSANEIAAVLGISDEAAQKRVGRAVERLRQLFAKRGISIGAGVLVVVISAQAVQASPSGLVSTISAGALTGGTATVTAAATATKTAALTAFQKLLIIAGIAVVVGAGIYEVQRKRQIIASGRQNVVQTVNPSTTSPPPALEARQPVIREPLSDASLFTLDSAPGSLALQPDGKILVGSVLFGGFIDPQTGRLGFYNRTAMRLNADGTLDRTFLTDSSRYSSSSFMAHLAIATNGKVLVTGSFDAIEGEPRRGIAVLHPDGSLDKSMVPWLGQTNTPARLAVPEGVYPAAFLPDGTVGIVTTSLEGPPERRYPETVYRLDTNGSWITPTNHLVGGEFLRPSGLIRTLGEIGFWARQPVEWTRATPNPTVPVGDMPFGVFTLAPTAYNAAKVFRALFEEVPISLCRYAVPLPEGGTIIAVQDQFINGSLSAPGRFMRFDSNWQPDLSFTNYFESDRRGHITLRRQPDGRLLVAGLQGRMNGQDCAGITRLEADGRTDPSFHCDMTNGLDGRVMDMVLQPDGRIIICGFFSVVNGVEVPHIARLNPDGSLDATFRPPFMTRHQFALQRQGRQITIPVASVGPLSTTPVVANQSVPSKTIIITQLTLSGDAAQVQYTGEPRQTYILQGKDKLEDSEWTNISTNQASAIGNGTLFDPQAGKFPQRFYRIARQ